MLSTLLGINTNRGFGPGGNGAPLNRQFDSATGELIGDTYLPRGTDVQPTGKKGYYRVFYNGTELGSLEPGGSHGKFKSNGTPLPQQAYDQLNPGSSGGGGNVQSVPGSIVTDRQSFDGGEPGSSSQPGAGYLTQLFGPDQFRAGVDPGYQFRLQQGAQGILNQAGPQYGSLSGPALKALIDYNQGAASQEFGAAFDRQQTQQGNIFQRLSSIAGLGQSAAAGVGQQGVLTGQTIGGNITGAANAQAAGTVGAANAYSGALGSIAGLAAYPYLRGK